MPTRQQKTSSIVKENLQEYGRYVLEDRALPDCRDGLKPVQRRVLWVLYNQKRTSKAIPVKSATVVGETIGKYHPHGDEACYGALVNMGWMRYPLIQKHGNFGNKGSLLTAPPAKYRYTETRLTEFADRIFDDISIVDMEKSFTEEHEEPSILPVRVPMLLVNGCTGVAVGLATNIPPHNLKEVINAAIIRLENPERDEEYLLKHSIKGPDYGSGVLLSGKDELLELYTTGRGRLQYSCNYEFEDGKRGRKRLVVTGLAPGFKANKLVDETQKLVEQKLLLSAANDEGSLETGTRIVIEYTDQNIINDRVLPMLRSSITYQFYALDEKRNPKLFSLTNLLDAFLDMRRDMEAKVIEEKLQIISKKILRDQALIAAVDNLKAVLSILNNAPSVDAARKALQKKLSINKEQADYILDASVRSLLRKVNREDIEARIESLLSEQEDYRQQSKNIDKVVGNHLGGMLSHADKRGTKIGKKSSEPELIATTDYYIGVTEAGVVDSSPKLPTASRATWKYVGMVKTPGRFSTVTKENVGQSIALSFLDKFDPNAGQVIGLASEEHECVVAVTKDGYYVAFPPVQRRTRFPVFKEMPEDGILFAAGMKSSDVLAVQRSGLERCNLIPFEELQVTRPNVKAKKLPGFQRKKIEIVGARIIPAGGRILNLRGERIAPSKTLRGDEPYFYVSRSNLVVLEDGRRMEKSGPELQKLLETDDHAVKYIVAF